MPAGFDDYRLRDLIAGTGQPYSDERHCKSCRCEEIAKEERSREPHPGWSRKATADDSRPRFGSQYIDRSRV